MEIDEQSLDPWLWAVRGAGSTGRSGLCSYQAAVSLTRAFLTFLTLVSLPVPSMVPVSPSQLCCSSLSFLSLCALIVAGREPLQIWLEEFPGRSVPVGGGVVQALEQAQGEVGIFCNIFWLSCFSLVHWPCSLSFDLWGNSLMKFVVTWQNLC